MTGKIVFLLLLFTFTSYTNEFMRLRNTLELTECVRTENNECSVVPNSKPIKIRDIDTEEDKKYVTDEKNIYYLGENNYSYDKKYYSIFKNVDVKSFVMVGNSFVKDKKNVYYTTRWKNITLENADPKTFEYIGESYPFVYAKDKKMVYAIEKFGNPVYIIKDADPATFELLKENYSKDKNNVYFQEKPAKGIDVKTFEILGYFHVKDKNNVYMRSSYEYEPVKGADIETFEVLTPLYTKDKNNVYYNSEVIIGADSSTFEIMKNIKENEYEYAADKKRVYYNGEVISEAEPQTFELISSNFSKDKSHVYYKNSMYAVTGICVDKNTDEEMQPQMITNKINMEEKKNYEIIEISRPVFNGSIEKVKTQYCESKKNSSWKKLQNADPVTFEINYEIKHIIFGSQYSSSGIPRILISYMTKDKKNYYIDSYQVDEGKWRSVRDRYMKMGDISKTTEEK